MDKKERIIAYIDGFNLYYGLKNANYQRFYWLNIQLLIQNLLKPTQSLACTKYFTARISRPADKSKRQTTYLEALDTLSDFQIYYGHYLQKPVECRRCGNTWPICEEKMTDVNVATELLSDAFHNQFDTAFLVSADSDLVPPVKKIRQFFPNKRIVALFPPNRDSQHLKRNVHACISIGRGTLAKSQFADNVIKSDGYMLTRPKEWK